MIKWHKLEVKKGKKIASVKNPLIVFFNIIYITYWKYDRLYTISALTTMGCTPLPQRPETYARCAPHCLHHILSLQVSIAKHWNFIIPPWYCSLELIWFGEWLIKLIKTSNYEATITDKLLLWQNSRNSSCWNDIFIASNLLCHSRYTQKNEFHLNDFDNAKRSYVWCHGLMEIN